jgi:hypothetical protein
VYFIFTYVMLAVINVITPVRVAEDVEDMDRMKVFMAKQHMTQAQCEI